MKNKKINLIFFSPTGTTKQVLDSIAKGMNSQIVKQINLIKKDKITKQIFTDDELVMIGVPVHSSRIPLTVVSRLQNFKANKTKVILVVVYGNRHFGDALLELKDLAIELGFYPIAATAFIGVHSFSSSKYPIAEGRPNSKDLKLAMNFGERIMTEFEENKEIKVPGNYPYKERSDKLKIKPKIDLELCDRCGLCQNVCPVDAISIYKNKIEIDENHCIYCNACVRICPLNALIIDDERIIGFSKSLHEKCGTLQEPEIFL
ncbi:MAG: 4Fe-4S binding protein [FCB group bacterium]|nr:4Fe-4S binding protein [FCB group bacterium]